MDNGGQLGEKGSAVANAINEAAINRFQPFAPWPQLYCALRATILLSPSYDAFLASIALLASPFSARASLTFDLRAREVTGPNIIKLDEKKHVNVSGVGGKVHFDVWAIIQGADANLTNDRLQLYSFRIRTRGAPTGNLFADHLVNPDTGPVNGWETGAGATSGTMQDLDGDGDLDIGAPDFVFAIGTTGNANGRNLAPTAYNGPGTVAQFHVYSFELPITQLRFGITEVVLERSPVATAFLWREDSPTGFNKNGNTGTVAVNPNNIEFGVIPEPGTIALTVVGLTAFALATRRRRKV